SSRRSAPPTTYCPIRKSGAATTRARSTHRGRRRRHPTPDTTATMPPRAATLTRATRRTGTSRKAIVLPQGGTLNVTIPAGVEDGQTLRLRAKGAPSQGEGPPGDALVQIVVRPHRYFTREGDDILLDLPITVKEAALG